MNQEPRRTESAETSAAPAPKKNAWLKPVLLLTAVAAVMILAYVFDVGSKIQDLRDWIKGLGYWGPVVFVLIYGVATVAALPGVALTAVAGGLFGSLVGTVVVSIGSTFGAALAFLVARYFARSSVESWLKGNAKFQKLDRMTQEHGATMVAITRLVPLFPFNLLNYGFGLTGVNFWTYVFYSWLCMLPGTILYVVGFDALFKGLSEGRVPWTLIGVVAAMAVILTLLVRRARAKLKDKDPAAAPQGEDA